MPRRMGSPFSFGQAVLEPIVQPIYDRVTVLAATPNVQHRFFQNLAGKNERDFFSQITGGGQLSAPKLAVVYGIRLVWSEAVATDTDILPDLKLLLYNSWYRLKIGVKNYVEVPSFYLPGGVGIAGFAGSNSAAAIDYQTATSGVPAFFSRFSIEKRRIAIPPQQAFFGELNGVGIAGMGSDRDCWNFLDGEFGQEVM